MKLMKCLIIDDNQASMVILSMILEKFSFSSVMAESIPAALYALDYSDFDLIVLDLTFIEGPSGFDFLKTRLERPEIENIPVFILSGSSDFTSMYECFKHGVNGFLIKPVKENLLHKLLKQNGLAVHR